MLYLKALWKYFFLFHPRNNLEYLPEYTLATFLLQTLQQKFSAHFLFSILSSIKVVNVSNMLQIYSTPTCSNNASLCMQLILRWYPFPTYLI